MALGLAGVRAAVEVLEELAIGRQHHGGVAAAERSLIGLHGPVERGEGRVTSEALSEQTGALGVALASGGLGFLVSRGERDRDFAVGASDDLPLALFALGPGLGRLLLT